MLRIFQSSGLLNLSRADFGGDGAACAVGLHQALHEGRVGNSASMIEFRQCALLAICRFGKQAKISLGRSIAKQGFQLLPARAKDRRR